MITLDYDTLLLIIDYDRWSIIDYWLLLIIYYWLLIIIIITLYIIDYDRWSPTFWRVDIFGDSAGFQPDSKPCEVWNEFLLSALQAPQNLKSDESASSRPSSRWLCFKVEMGWNGMTRDEMGIMGMCSNLWQIRRFDLRLYMYAFMTHCDVCLRVGEPLGGTDRWPVVFYVVTPWVWWWCSQEPNLWFWNRWRWPRSQRWTQHSSRSWRICSGREGFYLFDPVIWVCLKMLG